MVQTQMATKTEVEGEPTVLVPPAVAEGLEQEQQGENQTAPVTPEEGKTEESSQEAAPQGKTETETGEAHPNRRERRIGEFIDKLKDKEKENSALRDELEKLKGAGTQTLPQEGFYPQSFGLPPWEVPQAQPGMEVTPEQYTQQVVGTARNLTAIELDRFKKDLAKVDNFKDDLRYVESKYDVLNPDKKEVYDEVSSKKITDLYIKASAGDPNLRLRDFVDSIMSFRQEGRNEGMAEGTNTVLKNQGESAIPPSTPEGKRSNEVNPDNMSSDELEAYLKKNGLWDQ